MFQVWVQSAVHLFLFLLSRQHTQKKQRLILKWLVRKISCFTITPSQQKQISQQAVDAKIYNQNKQTVHGYTSSKITRNVARYHTPGLKWDYCGKTDNYIIITSPTKLHYFFLTYFASEKYIIHKMLFF